MEDTSIQTRGNPDQIAARARLLELFRTTPIPGDQLLTNLALYMRSPVIAKVLYVDELYREIISLPGVVLEFGVWWGQNLALLESFRAVYEPYNYTRRLVGFDTFSGYSCPTSEDGRNELVQEGAYPVTSSWEAELAEILAYHEAENPMGHIRKFELVKGDATETVGPYLEAHPETVIAMAYFDMQLYEPTVECLGRIKPHLMPGSVLAMDELNCAEFPGETIAFREVFGASGFKIRRSKYLPDRTLVTIQ